MFNIYKVERQIQEETEIEKERLNLDKNFSKHLRMVLFLLTMF